MGPGLLVFVAQIALNSQHPRQKHKLEFIDSSSVPPLCENLHLQIFAFINLGTNYLQKCFLVFTFYREVFNHIHIPSISMYLQERWRWWFSNSALHSWRTKGAGARMALAPLLPTGFNRSWNLYLFYILDVHIRFGLRKCSNAYFYVVWKLLVKCKERGLESMVH